VICRWEFCSITFKKTQLVRHCAAVYKQRFIRNIEAAIAGADTADAFVTALSAGLAAAIPEDWDRRRLCYDIRGQAMFNPDFQPVVDEIEARLNRIPGDAARRFGAGLHVAMGVAARDGMFRYHAQRRASGGGRPRAEIATSFADMLMRPARPARLRTAARPPARRNPGAPAPRRRFRRARRAPAPLT
jgi:TetR/AcrR family transcriptional repressor of bet genes